MNGNGDPTIQDIMTKNVTSVTPATSILEASELLLENEFNGLPVVDQDGKVVGIVTEYDLLSKGTAIHLPTFLKLFGDYPGAGREEYLLKGKLGDILAFSVKDIMNTDPLTLPEDASVSDVVLAFGKHHRVNPIPVVSKEGKLAGIVSRYDVIKFYARMLERIRQNANGRAS